MNERPGQAECTACAATAAAVGGAAEEHLTTVNATAQCPTGSMRVMGDHRLARLAHGEVVVEATTSIAEVAAQATERVMAQQRAVMLVAVGVTVAVAVGLHAYAHWGSGSGGGGERAQRLQRYDLLFTEDHPVAIPGMMVARRTAMGAIFSAVISIFTLAVVVALFLQYLEANLEVRFALLRGRSDLVAAGAFEVTVAVVDPFFLGACEPSSIAAEGFLTGGTAAVMTVGQVEDAQQGACVLQWSCAECSVMPSGASLRFPLGDDDAFAHGIEWTFTTSDAEPDTFSTLRKVGLRRVMLLMGSRACVMHALHRWLALCAVALWAGPDSEAVRPWHHVCPPADPRRWRRRRKGRSSSAHKRSICR